MTEQIQKTDNATQAQMIMYSKMFKINCIRQITRLPKKVSPPDRGGES